MPARQQPLPALPGAGARAERILEERTRLLAARSAAPADAAQRSAVLVCALGEELYGLPLPGIARVLPLGPIAPMPGAPPAMLGLYGRTGQLFSVLDLAAALGRGAPSSPAAGSHLVLLRQAPRRFALRIDRALAVAEVAAIDQPPPGSRDRAVTGHALAPPGLAGEASRLLGLVDLGHLLNPFLNSPSPPEREP